MKYSLLFILLIPAVAFSQQRNSISLIGGVEFLKPKTHAWNVELNFNRQFANAIRWSSELGVNFSIIEYKGDSREALLTNELYVPAYGAVLCPGYVENQLAHYSKETCVQFQAGINHLILNKEKFHFSVGLNFVNELQLKYKEHGQRVLTPAAGYGDTLELVNSHYNLETSIRKSDNAINIQIQPHLDIDVRLSDKVWFTSRFAYYSTLLPTLGLGRFQLNVGISYDW
jgi:hypothetical protein